MSLYSLYKIPQPRGYILKDYLVEDESTDSPDYFVIQSVPEKVGGGRHLIKLKGNGINLRYDSTIDVEFIDSEGQNIFTEVVDLVDRFGVYYIYFDIYDITARGVGYLHVVGVAKFDLNGRPLLTQQQKEYNVRWSTSINIEPFERNNSDLIFNEPPLVQANQIITPIRTSAIYSASAFAYTTQSVSGSTIQTSYFNNTDLDFQSSLRILDKRLRSIRVNPFAEPTTENSVYTFRRVPDVDITNGFLLPQTNRYNTRLIIDAVSGSLQKEHVGGLFSFTTTPEIVLPNVQSGVTVPSQSTQLQRYEAQVTEVVNDKLAYLEYPVVVETKNSNSITTQDRTHIYYQVKNFTGSVIYIPSSNLIQSSNLNEKYVEFTFRDIQPISGEVYRIKASARLGSLTGDYKLLHDQIITPVEYLTDNAYPNITNYARNESDYLLIGHFTTQDIVDNYWSFLRETPTDVNSYAAIRATYPLMDSMKLAVTSSQTTIAKTQFYQNYNKNQVYTISFYVYLEPYTELEIYMSSDMDNINTTVIGPDIGTYPKAFFKSKNNEQNRYSSQYNKFGKLIGKITNDRPKEKYYGKVLFDFTTDAEGFGGPLFRAKVVDYDNYSGSAYVSECSIKPYRLNGFTPNIVQFATQLPAELAAAVEVSQSIDFKLDYFDYEGRQSEYTTYLDDLVLDLRTEIPSNTCQDDVLYFTWRPEYGFSGLYNGTGNLTQYEVYDGGNWNDPTIPTGVTNDREPPVGGGDNIGIRPAGRT